MNELVALALICWLLALLLALSGKLLAPARWLLAAGSAAMVACAATALPHATRALRFGFGPGAHGFAFQLDAQALWLALFGYLVATIVCLLRPPANNRRWWIAGAAFSLTGALGVFGLQDTVSFLIAWEVMSLGGGCLLVGDRIDKNETGRSTLFMLVLLEAGAVAILAALLILSHAAGSFSFDTFHAVAAGLPLPLTNGIGVLLLLGFGAKLGIMPFYEWMPRAYGCGSGASGALLSGVILNAAFFALSRGLGWLPGSFALGTIVTGVAIVSALLAILFAFQQEDWRELLSFSTAENACIAVTLLGASLLFRANGLEALAALGWIVALLHMAGHSLAKGAMFLAADGIHRVTGNYHIAQRGWMKCSAWWFGVGVVFAGMSLAAMPPQAGFVSEWFAFQTLFLGFHLPNLGGRLVLALAGAGLALTAAIAFATFVKLVGVGNQGASDRNQPGIPRRHALAVGVLGLCVLALAVGMPWWLSGLNGQAMLVFGTHAAGAMHQGPILVPLSTFAFISPTLLVIVCPLLAILPAFLLWQAAHRHPVRRVPVWYGGFERESPRVATTALTFSNAMRVLYSFIYRPTLDVAHEHREREYFVHRTHLRHGVAPLFEPLLFRPLTRAAAGLAERLRALQSGHMNFYLSLIGILLALALALAVWV